MGEEDIRIPKDEVGYQTGKFSINLEGRDVWRRRDN